MVCLPSTSSGSSIIMIGFVFCDDIWCEEKKDKIREELVDVLNYCILMADACGLDMDEIIREKVRKNAEKYPVEKAYGHKEKYTELGE